MLKVQLCLPNLTVEGNSGRCS